MYGRAIVVVSLAMRRLDSAAGSQALRLALRAGAESYERFAAHRTLRAREVAVSVPVGQVYHERVRAPSALDASMADPLPALRTLLHTPLVDGRRDFLGGEVDCEGVPAVRALVWLSHTRPLAVYATNAARLEDAANSGPFGGG